MLFRFLGSLTVASLLLAQNNPPPRAAAPAASVEPPKVETSASSQAPIRVQVNEVIVPVTVTDDKGKFVSNLDAADFKVYEEGKEQQIRFFTRERSQPVVVGFLIDQSNAMKLHWKAYLQDAAQELALALLPGDPKYSGYLISYGNDAELAVNTTTDSEKIVDKIRKMKPGGGSALYDAIYMACTNRALVKGEPIEPRRVVIIIGDGHDNASKHTLDQVIELAQRNLVTIYAREHGRVRLRGRGGSRPQAPGGGNRRTGGPPSAEHLRFGRRLPGEAIGRRKLRHEGGHRRLRSAWWRATSSRPCPMSRAR